MTQVLLVCLASTLILQAFASFAAALTVDPKHVEALRECAAVHKSCGQFPDAIDKLEKAYTICSTDAKIQEAYATALTAWGTQLSVHCIAGLACVCSAKLPELHCDMLTFAQGPT